MSVCVFIIVGGIERSIVRVRVEELVEQQKILVDVRRHLEDSEIVIAALREDLTRVPAQRATGSHLATNANIAPSGSDTGATWQPWS